MSAFIRIELPTYYEALDTTRDYPVTAGSAELRVGGLNIAGAHWLSPTPQLPRGGIRLRSTLTLDGWPLVWPDAGNVARAIGAGR